MIVDKVSELIGNTPILRIPIPQKDSVLLLKMEKMNPGGSTKDRMAYSMVVAAIKSGRLRPGGVVVESSSGNTAIGLAIAAAEFGLRFIAVVDHHAAPDKINVMRAFGAEIHFVEGDFAEDEVATVERQRLAAQLAEEIPGAIFMNQSDNTANAGGYVDFVREAIEQSVGRIDAYVGCVGTGGSVTGIGHGLKAHSAATRIVAVEPQGSIVFGGPGHSYYQSGTGTPPGDTVGLVLDYSCIDVALRVTDSQAFETARYLARRYSLLVGGSTGGALYKALELVADGGIAGNVLVSIADGGEKYLQTIFNDAWMAEKKLRDPTIWSRLDGWFGRPANSSSERPEIERLSARSMRPLEVTICGGGRTGHLDVVLFSQRPGVRVSWLTSDPEVVSGAAAGGLTATLPDGSTITGQPALVGTDAAGAVAHADVVVLTVPANARADALRSIARYLPREKPVHVGAIPGFCGFDWLAEDMLANRPNAVIWGMKDVPHTAFDLRPGRSIRMGGPKSRLHVATHRRESAENRAALASHLATLFEAPVDMLDDYLEITLTPGNPIMHSSVIYGLIGPAGEWRDRPLPEDFCWWTDCPELGAWYLERCDAENRMLRRAAERRLGIDLSSVKPLKTEIEEAYGDQIADARTMLSVLRTNQAYADIRAPLVRDEARGGYRIDKQSRAFHEDVVYGLGLLKRMGEQLDVPTPHISEIYDWALDHIGGLDGDPLSYVPNALQRAQ